MVLSQHGKLGLSANVFAYRSRGLSLETPPCTYLLMQSADNRPMLVFLSL